MCKGYPRLLIVSTGGVHLLPIFCDFGPDSSPPLDGRPPGLLHELGICRRCLLVGHANDRRGLLGRRSRGEPRGWRRCRRRGRSGRIRRLGRRGRWRRGWRRSPTARSSTRTSLTATSGTLLTGALPTSACCAGRPGWAPPRQLRGKRLRSSRMRRACDRSTFRAVWDPKDVLEDTVVCGRYISEARGPPPHALRAG